MPGINTTKLEFGPAARFLPERGYCQVNRNSLFFDAKSILANTTNQRLNWHVDQWKLQEIR